MVWEGIDDRREEKNTWRFITWKVSLEKTTRLRGEMNHPRYIDYWCIIFFLFQIQSCLNNFMVITWGGKKISEI